MKRLSFLWLEDVPELDHLQLAAWWGDVIEAISDHSPTIENVGMGKALLDATGVGALYGNEMSWCQAVMRAARAVPCGKVSIPGWRMGVAHTKFGAEVAAGMAPKNRGYWLAAQDERCWLAPLRLDWLPLDVETLRRCSLLGIHSIGQFAALPASSVVEQFGVEAGIVHGWALGNDRRPLQGVRQQVIEVSYEVEAAELHSDMLVAMLESSAWPKIAELDRAGLTVRRLALVLADDQGNEVKKSAWLDDLPGPELLSRVLIHLLDGLTGQLAGISEATLRFTGIDVQMGRQLDLFANTSERLRLEQTLKRLVRKHTNVCVLRPVLAAPFAPIRAERYGLEAYSL